MNSSLPEIGFECLGKTSVYMINLVIFLNCGILPIAYFIIFGDLAKSLFILIESVESTDFLGERAFPVLILGVICLPMILSRRLAELKVAAIILFSGVIAFCILLVV